MKHILSVLIIFALLATYQPPSFAQTSCDGLVPTRLNVGATARIVFNGDGLGSQMRDNPGKEQSGSQVIDNIPEGSVVTLIEGPVCLDGAVWWKVSLTSGAEGWIAEGDAQQYYLENFVLGTEVMAPNRDNPRELMRWFITYTGEVTQLTSLEIPQDEPRVARDVWQQPDIDAANTQLANRRAQCPDVLIGTPWENITDAGEVVVVEADYEFIPAPEGGRIFLIRHWVLPIPTCGGGPGEYFGVSTTHLVREGQILDLFPYGQHGGVRSRNACMSPEVNKLSWATDMAEVVWSPDGDTVALSVRYLEEANSRLCAFYSIFLVDVFNQQVIPIEEGRRLFWSAGGTRLYYTSFVTDPTGYNIQEERLMVLSDAQSTRVNVPVTVGVQLVPSVFNSTGVILPVSSDSSLMLVCNTLSGCPGTLEFDVRRSTFSTNPIPLPSDLLPRQIAQVHYVADDGRLLWLTTDGRVYIQSLRDPSVGLWDQIMLDTLVTHVVIVPTGIAAVLVSDSGDFFLLNTITREVLPILNR